MEAQFRNIPEALWEQVAPLIPVRRKKTLRGRPPVPDREVFSGIVYRLLRTARDILRRCRR